MPLPTGKEVGERQHAQNSAAKVESNRHVLCVALHRILWIV